MPTFFENLPLVIGQALFNFLDQFLPAWLVVLIIALLISIILLLFMILTLIINIVLERKLVARLQDRLGPNRVGPYGFFQTVADTIKLMIKEDITPVKAHRLVFNLAPIIIVIPLIMTLAIIPYGQNLAPVDLNIGILYFIAISSTTVIPIIMAGWSSRNKYALLGAMRAVAQLISYEIPQVLSVVGVLILAGSLSMVSIVQAQAGVWFILLQPLGFLIFFISSLAEIERAPFDIPEAESEIVAGYHIEYSGMKFAMIFLVNFFSPFVIAAVAATLFLGGWQPLLIPLPSYVWFLIKTYFVFFIILWIRGTLPRVRIDQLMAFGWKILVPLTLANLLLTALLRTILVGQPQSVQIGAFLAANLALFIVTAIIYALATRQKLQPQPTA